MPQDTPTGPRTPLELLQHQAERHGDKVAFGFSYQGDDQDRQELTYRELDERARAIAARLQRLGAAGERVLVLCRPGLDGIAGFFGCVYAGAVAVPIHERMAPRLSSVVPDSQAGFALAPPETSVTVKTEIDNAADQRRVRWCLTDVPAAEADGWAPPRLDADATALIQYTSGSTKAPKGVVVSQRNVMHNVETIRQMWHGNQDDVVVSWLPQHHDMGLIGTTLHPLYIGATTELLAPAAFIKTPMLWLEAVSRHRATVTVAPNFAYKKCVERSSVEQRAALDLSTLKVAMNGAEPVQAETLRAFSDAFAPAGFRREAFLPVFGLAEATLLVTGGSDSPLPTVAHLDRGALGHNRVVDAAPGDPATIAVTGCGRVQGGQRVAIVDPETHCEHHPGEVGEIWIAGPSVAGRYWHNPEETEQTFSASLPETGEGPFLRTGDLGFMRSGELFITGRFKDLVVIDGTIYYPNDIEATVQDCHPTLLSDRGAVFAMMTRVGAPRKLVIVQEVGLNQVDEAALHEIVAAIQTAVVEHQRLPVYAVLLAAPMTIPTTSSGKVQRSKCRQQFFDDELQTLAEWHAPPDNHDESLTVRDLVNNVAATRGPSAADGVANLLKEVVQNRGRSTPPR